MNGADFFDLAQSLARGPEPARLRTATSRAYYGAFHTAFELLKRCGIAMRHGPECHAKVRWVLDHAGDPDIKTASEKLSSLRAARNDADYELSNKKPESKSAVERNLAVAKEVIDCIRLCMNGDEKAQARDKMRDYAKNVLKLPVS